MNQVLTTNNPRKRKSRGSAIVEFALSSPLLILLLGASLEFARVFYTAMATNQVARAGAQMAMMPAMSTVYSAIQTAAVKGQPTLTNITATASLYCENSSNAMITCPSTPPAGTRVYVKTVASATDTYLGSYGFLPQSIGMNSTSYMRVQ